MDVISKKICKSLKGQIEIPSDKSISHRAAMFTLLTKGKQCKISNFSEGEDCHSTLRILRNLGCDITFKSKTELIINAEKVFNIPMIPLDCGNSGTTMRLMTGILAGQDFNSTLVGDKSLSKRPMKRIIEPLSLMGANIKTQDYTAPLSIIGQRLHGIHYKSNIASAQVKSAVLLAGLFAEGETIFTEKAQSRNHTELMLEYLGADIKTDKNTIMIKPSKLEPKNIDICGDISSAAFFMVAAAIIPDSEITLKNVGLNPTRAGIIEIMKKMGADIKVENISKSQCEPVGDIKIKYSDLKATEISGEIIPKLIDELPVIALLATQAEGTTVIKDAADLKNKETDRIRAISDEFTKLGIDIIPTDDGFIINGKQKIKGDAEVNSYHDHRIAMTLYIAGMIAQHDVLIHDFEWVSISFPNFLQLVNELTV